MKLLPPVIWQNGLDLLSETKMVGPRQVIYTGRGEVRIKKLREAELFLFNDLFMVCKAGKDLVLLNEPIPIDSIEATAESNDGKHCRIYHI